MIEMIATRMAERIVDPLSVAVVLLGLVVILLISPVRGAALEPTR